MIRHITGTVQRIENTGIIVDVQGIGYEVFVSSPTSFTIDETVTLHTHHVVRETAADLYGFVTMDELSLFELLLNLPKIGPKSAAQILAQADLELIANAISNDDPAHLSKLSGIGKKTAEKIVAGLKDSFADGAFGANVSTTPTQATTTWQSDAIDALISLGYPHSEARAVVQNLPENITSTSEAVKAALSQLGAQ